MHSQWAARERIKVFRSNSVIKEMVKSLAIEFTSILRELKKQSKAGIQGRTVELRPS
jgi:hypothetical protein